MSQTISNAASAAASASSTSSAAASDPLARLNAAESALDKATSSAHAVVSNPLWTPELVRFLAIAILIFTFGALLLGAVLLWREKAQGNQILRVFGVITIIGISSLLLIVGFSNEQLTPIIGLFGAIAGYLLGKDAQKDP